MLELINETSWSASIYPGWGKDRHSQMTIVVKAGFAFDAAGTLRALDESSQIEETDRHYEGPSDSSLAAASEVVPFKHGSEVIAFGTVYPPKANARAARAALGVVSADGRRWHKTLQITGLRYWRKTLTGTVMTEPEPMGPIPLRYEYAYGGRDERDERRFYARNPVGQGYTANTWRVNGLALPQIEYMDKPVRRPGNQPPPAGFGPLPSTWSPRSELWEGLDEEAAQAGLCPYGTQVPAALYNAAPIDQRFDRPFEGGEQIVLQGLVAGVEPSRATTLKVPSLAPALSLQTLAGTRRLEARCDTVVLDTDEQTLNLVWRSAVPWLQSERRQGWVTVREPDQGRGNRRSA